MVLLAHSLLAGRLTSEEFMATQETIWKEEAQGKLRMFTRSRPGKQKEIVVIG